MKDKIIYIYILSLVVFIAGFMNIQIGSPITATYVLTVIALIGLIYSIVQFSVLKKRKKPEEKREVPQKSPAAASYAPLSSLVLSKETGNAQIDAALKQVQESAKIVNSTKKPDVFFKRLGFLLDKLLFLQQFENQIAFYPHKPSQYYKSIIVELGETVDGFIDRALAANKQEIAKLKTTRAKDEKYADFIIALISAFDCANTFWTGNKIEPHYTGPLYTKANYERVEKLYYDLDDIGP